MSEEASVAEQPVQESQEIAQESEQSNAEMEAQQESQAEETNESSNGGSVEVKAETEQELKEEIEEAIEEGASEEEVEKMIEQFTLKVNGKEFIKEIDLSDKDALKKELQLAAAARPAMQESAELKKLFNKEIERLKEDPFKVLEELGIDPLEISAKKIEQFLEEQSKSPEEIERDRQLREFEELKAENERLKQQRLEEKKQEQMHRLEQELQTDIMSALEDAKGDLPNTPEVVAMVAENMLFALENGFEDVTAKDVIPTVKNDLQSKFRSIMGSMNSTDAIKALLGDEVTNKLREDRLQKMKDIPSVKSIKQGSIKEEEKEQPREKVALSSLFK